VARVTGGELTCSAKPIKRPLAVLTGPPAKPQHQDNQFYMPKITHVNAIEEVKVHHS
jgi:hypothetical protein